MTTIDEIYATCLAAAHLQGQDLTATIEGGEIREFTDPKTGALKRKLFLKLAGQPQMFAVNVTNARRIAAIYGGEVSEWIGKPITLYPTTTEFAGKEVACIRVRQAGATQTFGAAASTPAPAPQASQAAAAASGVIRF